MFLLRQFNKLDFLGGNFLLQPVSTRRDEAEKKLQQQIIEQSAQNSY